MGQLRCFPVFPFTLYLWGGMHLPCCLGWFQTPGLKRSVSDCGCDFSHSL